MTELEPPDIERPKKRKKRSARKVIFLLLLLVVAAWIAYEALWAITGEPAPLVDYHARMQELVESHQPEGVDGWQMLLDATIKLGEVDATMMDEVFPARSEDIGDQIMYDLVLENPLDMELIARERRGVALFEELGGTEVLAQAAQADRFIRPVAGGQPNQPLLMFLLPELSQFRQIAKLRAAGMRLAAERGDEEEVAAAFEQMLAMGRACAAQSFIIDRLVGLAIFHLAADELSRELIEHDFSDATLQQLEQAIERQMQVAPIKVALEGERSGFLDTVQWTFSDDGHGDGRIDLNKLAGVSGGMGMAPAGGSGLFSGVRSLFYAGRAETVEVANDFFDRLIEDAELEPAVRHREGFDSDGFLERLSNRLILVKNFMPALGKVVQQDDVFLTRRTALRVMIALERFKLARGDYPASLDALVPEFLPAAPVDPMHGGQFIYRLLEGETNGLPYVLYTTGIDQIDDAADTGFGDVEQILSFSRIGPHAEGGDLLLNPSREKRPLYPPD